MDNNKQWEYYQHCYIRRIYELPLDSNLSFRQIEKQYLSEYNLVNKSALFAQYITKFDVGEETDWWCTIKDSEYDLSKLQSKKRYEVTKAHKFCESKRIKACEYENELFQCYIKAFDAYPEKYRPKTFDFDSFRLQLKSWDENQCYYVYACFFRETKQLIGFCLLEKKMKFVKMVLQKTDPSFEKYNSNASLVDCFLNDWNDELKLGKVCITNGSRSVKHETNFNAYLEKYFGFRKAYANIRIVYRFPIGFIVKLLKPFAKIFEHTDNALLYNFYCVLKMDSFARD